LPELERTEWLTRLASTDPKLAAEVADLLAQRERSGYASFLAEPLLDTGNGLEQATLRGRHVGPYVVESEVGRGGMGSVWRARRIDERFENTVAIKFLHASWIGLQGEQRFRAEGHILGRLDHPNIARLIDAGLLDATHPYLVLEFVEGEAIDAYCHRMHLTLDARIGLFLEVLAAVAHAHSHLIVHRDIKPANIFVTRNGSVKLLDFGIAKLLDAAPGSGDLSSPSAVALTPQFAAPEQLLGQAVTTATDVYSLGLVLYLLLTGRHPIGSDTASHAQLLQAALTEEAPRASSIGEVAVVPRRSLAGDLDNVLAKAMRKIAAERYASVADFAEDLKRYLLHEPVKAGPDTLRYRTTKFVRRHRGGVAVTLLLIIAIVGGLVGTTWQARRADAAAIQADQQRQRALQQLNYSQATSEFLAFLLQQGSNRPFTTPELLARGEQLIQGQFTNDPALRAKLLLTLASLYGQASQQGKSEQLYVAAQALAHQTSDESLQADADCALAHEYGDQRLFDKSLPALDAAILKAEATPSIDSDVVAECHIERSEVRLDYGEATPALADAQIAVNLLGNVGDGEKLLLLQAHTAVADAKGALGDDAAAVAQYRAAIDLLSGMGRGQTEYAASYYTNMGRNLSRAGQWLEAASAYESSIKVSQDVAAGGAADPIGLTNYAKLLIDLGRTKEAIQMFDAAIAAAIHIQNSKSVAMATVLSAPAFCTLGNLKECASRLSQGREVLARQLSPKNSIFGTLDMYGAELALAGKEPAVARERLQSALKIFASASEFSPNTLRALALLTEVELSQGDTASAQHHSVELLAKAREALHGFATSAWVGRALLVQAEVLQALGKSDDARASLEHSLAVLHSTVGVQGPWSLQAERLLAH
jgi:serine/threonine protein kinase/tetratricopeptide (TPR) repeat protein